MAHGIHRQGGHEPGRPPLLSHGVLERQRLRHRVLLLYRLEHEQHQRNDKIFTKSYVVYLPEDYDGLVFAAQAQPDNYADAMALDNLENVSPEGNIMDLAPLDPYASLYFSICG